MPTWQVVSKQNHANAGWTSPTDYRQTKHLSVIPALAGEFGHLIPTYPMAFLKNSTGKFQLCVLLGLKKHCNAFLDLNNRWTAQYVPANLRSYPFSLMESSNGQQVLAVDADSDFFHIEAQTNDKPVLNQAGTAHDSLKELIQFMGQRHIQQLQTDHAVDLLAQHQVLKEWQESVITEDGSSEQTVLKGLYCFDEKALQHLDGDALQTLASKGALGVAYAQLYSQTRLKYLVKRQQWHDKQTHSAQTSNVDLDKLFGESDSDDLFTF
ncbi:SapC family protein [Marinomonas fungiae]|uniref:SapC n=1 Tax=Marinomonas fungiae TaxID=1137284 RepID=A0A0K6II48_9GAMM|nr:SapC family protein [Marinomonas fungiae]CUB02768.1 SapC [Marinomonas fungiae]